MNRQRVLGSVFGWGMRSVALGVAVTVGAGLLTGVSHASPEPGPAAPRVSSSDRVVKGQNLPVKPRKIDPPGKAAPPVRWPVADAADVALPGGAHGKGPMVRAGDLPVWVGFASSDNARKPSQADKVRVKILDRAVARRLGIDGVVFTVAGTTAERLSVRLSYAGFAHAFGGDYGERLRLVELPACAMTTPNVTRCRAATATKSARNNGGKRTLSAEVDGVGSPGQPLVLAAQAAESGAKGDFTASSLSPSAEWQVSEQSGDFSWSHPLRVPPTPGGLAPNLKVGYSSGSIDGRTANTNNQPSWIGEGFEFSPGFIERRYKPCADDGAPTDQWGNKPGDQCWAYENATVTWNGKGGELIKTFDGSWRPKSDDGTKFEKLASTTRGNGDDNGEYWRVTTTDGTRYYFGYNRLPGWVDGKAQTGSAWTVPVFGNNSGEPCYKGAFADSWCDQAWRWNLDYVVDPKGNAIAYYYNQEANYYGRNLKPADDTRYVRGGWLDRIEYGLRSSDMYAKAPARVVATDSERCIADSAFDCAPSKIDANPEKWPDVPWDLNCSAGTQCGVGSGALSPTFWSRKRLTKITTQVQDSAGAYRDVDSWSLAHRWGDADIDRSLLLTSIRHTGHAAATPVSLPAVTFSHVQLMNRLDKQGDDIPPFIKYRVGGITDESGGQIDVNYSAPQCALAALPTPETNNKRCFPVYWTPPGRDDPIRDWFHKYVASQVIQTDRTGGAPDMITNYEYLDGAAWHYDVDDGITKEKYKTWGQWRGYGRVRVTTGGFDEGMLTQREALYLRGMDGDRAGPSGGTKDVSVPDDEGGSHIDHEAHAGFELKTTVYDKPGGSVVEKTVNTPWREETARRVRSWGTTTANLTGTNKTHTWVALSGGLWRETETVNTYETTAGRIIKVDDKGDINTPDDNLCTRTAYAEDTTAWKLDFPSQVETVSVACGVTPDRSTQVVSDQRSYYDGGAFGAAPTKGNVTKTERIAAHNGTTPTYVKVASTIFDSFGRVTAVTDAGNNTATTAYTDTNGLNTQVTATSPPVVAEDPTTSHVTVTRLDPALGEAISVTDPNNFLTQLQYDGLGRLRKVWLPNRTTSQTPNLEFNYYVTGNSIVAVGTKELNAQGGQKREAFQLFDGMLRPRQVQAPGPNGGRLIADTFYDARGNTVRTYDTYYSTGAPSSMLFGASEGSVETQIVSSYDGLDRVVAERLLVGTGETQEKWRTTFSYSGDRTHMTPPAGGTPTTTITDARGRTVELRQYKGSSPSGEYVSTRYSYTPAGQLDTVTDAAQNKWHYIYDLRGRKTRQEDPDTGTTNYVYDDLDLLISSTDANNETLFHRYDPLGRKLETRKDSVSGDLLTSWVYDTVRKGQLTSATRYAGGQQYTTRVNIYDNLYRPIRTTMTIPATEGTLAGNYVFGTSYRLDGLVGGSGFPAAGGMVAEGYTYAYDAEDLGRPVKLTGSGSTPYVTNTSYSYTGQLEQLELSSNGPRTWITNTYEYGTRRLAASRVERENVAGVDRNASYKYDPAGNVTSISDVSRSGTDNQCLSYDYLRRLTEAWAQDTADCASAPTDAVVGGPAQYWHSFVYDALGNRTKETQRGLGGASDTVRDYSYPATGQPQPHTLTSVTQSGGAGSRTDSFGYDFAGNTISRTVDGKAQNLDWDSEGHVAEITEGEASTSFVYDASGGRLIRRDPGGTTLYLPGMELRLDKGATAAKATRYYSHAGQTVAVRTLAGLRFLANDHHGSGVLEINAADQTLTQRHFTPFGAERSLFGSWVGEKGFVGGTKDPTGLTHLGAREYDPTTGRFISIDPLIDHSDPQQMHGYAYANNNPMTWSDPSGLYIPECQQGCKGNGGLGDSVSKGNKKRGSSDTHRSAEGRGDEQEIMADGEWRPAGPDGDLSVNDVALETIGKPYHELSARKQEEVLIRTICANFGQGSPECQALETGDADAAWELIFQLTGVADARDCFVKGQGAGCAWMAAVGPLKLLKGGKLARALRAARLAKKIAGTGLKNASNGIRSLYSAGTVRGQSISDIRAGLLADGFQMGLAKNKSGYLFRNSLGEEVRIMRRGGSWDIRVRNQYGNYLDEFGNVAPPSSTHGITVVS